MRAFTNNSLESIIRQRTYQITRSFHRHIMFSLNFQIIICMTNLSKNQLRLSKNFAYIDEMENLHFARIDEMEDFVYQEQFIWFSFSYSFIFTFCLVDSVIKKTQSLVRVQKGYFHYFQRKQTSQIYNVYPYLIEEYFYILKMTEIFIAALSSTRFDLNDEEQEFYHEEKLKEIQQVREALRFLHQFTRLPKKERSQVDPASLWNNLLVLSRIIGFESEFAIVNHLLIPPAILTQELCLISSPFAIVRHEARTQVGVWETAADKYYVLMEGMVEKEMTRTSILEREAITMEVGLEKKSSNSRFNKKNNRQKFSRTDEQIPICLNSKRSEGRGNESGAGNFKSITCVETFEVSAGPWRRYVGSFHQLQEEYLLNFIRKKLNLSLNFDGKEVRDENEEEVRSTLYSIHTLERKSHLEFSAHHLLLLYRGEMLVTTPSYKIEVSKGCILNPSIYRTLSKEITTGPISGTALVKSEATIIKISIKKLEMYFNECEGQKELLFQLLNRLQINRNNRKEEEEGFRRYNLKENVYTLTHSLTCNEPQSPLFLSNSALRNIVFSPDKPKRHASIRALSKDKAQLKNIENIVKKTAKVAELKHIEYLKKHQLSEEKGIKSFQSELMPLPIFKDCMRNIQTKHEKMRQVIEMQREKNRRDPQTKELSCTNLLLPPKFAPPSSVDKPLGRTHLLKKKMHQIFVMTEESEEIINFTTSGRPSGVEDGIWPLARKTVGAHIGLGKQLSSKQMYCVYEKWFRGGRGVMKKVPNGKIRRIKIN